MAISRRILLRMAAPLALLASACAGKRSEDSVSGSVKPSPTLGNKIAGENVGKPEEHTNVLHAERASKNSSLSDKLITVKQPFPFSVEETQDGINQLLVNIRTFGGKADGKTDNTSPLEKLRAVIGKSGVAYFPAVDGNTYFFGDSISFSDTEGLILDIPESVTLSMPDLCISNKAAFVRPTKVYSRELKITYIYSPSSTEKYANRPYWFKSEDRTQICIKNLSPTKNGMDYYEIYDQTTGIKTEFLPYLGDDAFVITNSGTDVQKVGLKNVNIGDELSFVFDGTSTSTTIVVIKTNSERYWISCGANINDNPILNCQTPGSSYINSLPISYFGMSTQSAYKYSLSIISVRMVGPQIFAVLVNGYEVSRVNTTSEIIAFGCGGSGGDGTVTIKNPVLKSNVKSDSGMAVSISVFGDSISMPTFQGSWPDLLSNQLDTCAGVRVLKVNNYSVAGNSSNEQLVFVTPENLSKSNISIFLIGTNDIQGDTGVNIYQKNMKAMFDAAIAANNSVIVGVPPMFYEKKESGGRGVSSRRSNLGAQYRIALEFLCGSYDNIIIVDIPSLSGIITGEFVNKKINPSLYSQHRDPMVLDNVHPTANMKMLMAQWFGNAVLRVVFGRKETLELPTDNLPSTWLKNHWVSATGDNSIAFSRDLSGNVSLCGYLNNETGINLIPAGTIIMIIPESLRPKRNHLFLADADGVVPIRITVATSGNVDVTGLNGAWLSLAGLSWATR